MLRPETSVVSDDKGRQLHLLSTQGFPYTMVLGLLFLFAHIFAKIFKCPCYNLTTILAHCQT